MIERKIEVEKDGVIKSVDENLVSTYINVGWSKVKNVKKESPILKKTISKED